MKIMTLVGARPQFVKEALVGEALRAAGWTHTLVHSGQHYDFNMSDVFFQELRIPAPAYHLGIGSGTHGAMTAAALRAVEEVLLQEKSDALLVYGDTNTTLAGALAAAKLHIPVIHVEAGIRMQPRGMPEEINRVLTDRISQVMCCCSVLGRQNLVAEGLAQGVFVTGDVMFDMFQRMRPHFTPEKTAQKMGLASASFVLATLHRDYNVDTPAPLQSILQGLDQLRERGFEVLLPLHPRTRARLRQWGLEGLVSGLHVVEPTGYIELMSLTLAAAFVVTDSGGLQKEAYYAGRRALVVMPDTGWRELTDAGWNILVPAETSAITGAAEQILHSARRPHEVYGNGHAAETIVDAIGKAL